MRPPLTTGDLGIYSWRQPRTSGNRYGLGVKESTRCGNRQWSPSNVQDQGLQCAQTAKESWVQFRPNDWSTIWPQSRGEIVRCLQWRYYCSWSCFLLSDGLFYLWLIQIVTGVLERHTCLFLGCLVSGTARSLQAHTNLLTSLQQPATDRSLRKEVLALARARQVRLPLKSLPSVRM